MGAILTRLGIGLALDLFIALLTGGSFVGAVIFGIWDDLLIVALGSAFEMSIADSILLSFGFQFFLLGHKEVGEESDADRQYHAWHYVSAVYDHRQHTYSWGHVTPEDKEELGILLGVAAFKGYGADVYAVIRDGIGTIMTEAEILAL